MWVLGDPVLLTPPPGRPKRPIPAPCGYTFGLPKKLTEVEPKEPWVPPPTR